MKRHPGIPHLILLMLAGVFSSGSLPMVSAQINETKLTASDGTVNHQYGESVAIDGTTAVVGVLYLNAAYVYDFDGSTWNEQKIVHDDGLLNGFSASVHVDGDTVIVGAPADPENGTDSGAAYIFRNIAGVWIQEQKLLASDGAYGDNFGISVHVDGDTAIVGAYLEGDLYAIPGSAYVFTRAGSTWTEQAKLIPADLETGALFGRFVALDQDTAVIGAPEKSDLGYSSGAAYVFARSGSVWTQEAKLLAADGEAADNFGKYVDINGDTVIVGAVFDDDGGDDAGAAYIFNRQGAVWTQTQKLVAADAAEDDYLGRVSLAGDYAVLGSAGDDDNGSNSGSIYIYQFNGSTWEAIHKISSSDGDVSDFFGGSVGISRFYAIAGAKLDDDNGDASGSVYIYDGFAPAPVDVPSMNHLGLILALLAVSMSMIAVRVKN